MGNVYNIKNTSKRSGTAYSVKIEVYAMWSLLYLIITHHRIRYILEITYLKHQGAYTKWIGYNKL